MSKEKVHFRRAFSSPYLSSADIVGQQTFTVKCVRLEPNKTKRTTDSHNTAYFIEKEIRAGEKLKPMILNATNSKTMKDITGSPYIDDWQNVRITVYVDSNVTFGRETVDGLRIRAAAPEVPQATDEQLATIQDYRDAGSIKPATEKWIKAHSPLNADDAAKLIKGLGGK